MVCLNIGFLVHLHDRFAGELLTETEASVRKNADYQLALPMVCSELFVERRLVKDQLKSHSSCRFFNFLRRVRCVHKFRLGLRIGGWQMIES